MHCNKRKISDYYRPVCGVWLTRMQRIYYSCVFHLALAEFRPSPIQFIHFHMVSSVISLQTGNLLPMQDARSQ